VARLAIAGSTGSIGTQALDVVEAAGDRFEVVALVAGGNRQVLQAQIDRWRPEVVGMGDPAEAAQLNLPAGSELVAPEEMPAALAEQAEVVLNAVVGYSGLPFTLAALERGRRLALANKESLVAGGPLVAEVLKSGGGEILPVDSEHAALHQCLAGLPEGSLARLLLTASGGPFRGRAWEEVRDLGPAEALNHPTWDMGPKVTVDSSTLMNKGLEVIEAHELFGVGYDRIEVVVHPQSVVHSMVETTDGSVLAQLSMPDMRLPIGYSLGWPERLDVAYGRIDWATVGALTFEAPDRSTFRALDLAIAAGRSGGTAPAWLNASNEVAVRVFLEGRIHWGGIVEVVESSMQSWDQGTARTVDELFEAHAAATAKAETVVDRLAAA
jgi:1-deoxy-D-xylulose-5-phosphate reductoisomerase